MRLELSSQQFSSDKELEVKSIKSLLIETSFKELFQKFIALILIHFGRNIDLGGINVILGKSGWKLSDDLLWDFVVKLFDFVQLFHF